MSDLSTVQAELNENLLDGKYLSKSQLIERLVKMNIDLDHSKVEQKQHFVEMYNRVIQEYDRRTKIKSILDTDIIDRPQKVLKRKRERDVSGEGELNPSRMYSMEEAENINRFRIDNNKHVEEREKNFVEQEDPEINQQNKFASKNLGLDNFMTKIHADLNSYKNRIRNNFEGALIEIKKGQSDKEQPRINFQQIKLDFPHGEARILSKKTLQGNSQTNLKSVLEISKNIPVTSNEKILQMSGNKKLVIDLNENVKEELDNSFSDSSDSSSSDSQNNADPNTIKQPLPRRNAILIQSIAPFPKNDSRNSRKSLPGSSKNIQEILKKIDIKLNQPLSPKNLNDQNKSSTFKSHLRDVQNSVLSQRRASINRMNSARQVVINIIETPSNVTEFSTANEVDSTVLKNSSEISLESFLIEAKIFDFKTFRYFIYYSFIMSGFILISYFILKNTDFSQIENKHIFLICLVALVLFGFILFKKLNSKKFFRKTANEDYETIKNIMLNLYSCEENPIGLFENNIIRDFSSKHQMSEETYKKFIFPLLKKLRDEEKTLVEGEVIIQEQAQNIWKLK